MGVADAIDVAREVERQKAFDAGIERLHAMGQTIITKGIPYVDGRDWDAEQMLDFWVGLYARNIAERYHDILACPNLATLYNIFKDRPVAAAVVGAGPSLDKNVDLLHYFPGIIIATDGAAKPLTARGIIPHVVVTVDPRPAVIAEMLDYQESVDQVLVASVCTSPDIAKVWRGRMVYTALDNPGTQFFDRIIPVLFPGMPRIPCVGNVGNTAVIVAHFLGASDIVLVGQDYGYTGNRFRCQQWVKSSYGAWLAVERFEKDAALDQRSGKVVDERTGILTYPPFQSYRKTLEEIVKTYSIDVVNATEGGILDNFKKASLADTVTSLIKYGHNMTATSARARVLAALEAER